MTPPARSRVDRAGKRLKDHRRGVAILAEPALSAELAIVEAFRGAHAEPMTTVAAELRRFAAQVSDRAPEVGQRLKRMETVLDKLVRQPTMALSRMHDIAGCRAIFAHQHPADALIDAVRAHPGWTLQPKAWDYVAKPKSDGYRAKHLVVIVDGLSVEIQVRTALQHEWAELVERLDHELGLRTKFGETDPALAAALLDASNAVASYERGELDLAATMGRLFTPIILAYLDR